MRGKWRSLVYIDLLAGPGRDIEYNTEFDGSPLIALRVQPAFDRLFLGDMNPAYIEALRSRIGASDLLRLTLMSGDCNRLIDEVIAQFPPKSLGLAFVDPQGFEVNFRTLAALGKRQIDVMYLFPSGIGLRRNLRNFVNKTDSLLDRWWGNRKWRELPIAKWAAGEFTEEVPESIVRSFVTAFQRRAAEAGFRYYDEAAPLFANTRNAQMYHLLFFSHHATALKIWRGIKKIAPGGQRNLPGFD